MTNTEEETLKAPKPLKAPEVSKTLKAPEAPKPKAPEAPKPKAPEEPKSQPPKAQAPESSEAKSTQGVVRLKDLKKKNPEELRIFAEESGIENAGMMLKQDIIFLILKNGQKI